METGYILTTDGPGILMSLLAGSSITMEIGIMILNITGFGFPDIHGRQPEFDGSIMVIIFAGHLFRRPVLFGLSPGKPQVFDSGLL